ncbi:hypothetical protein MLD38_013474 [Melastoma candidum]|uniref:Uncharacterized protein n=1 Tax=Melastoma candidum TaxID=119954 RepID=A0ACB9R9N3_9MYRT|nr:hypothetical protein MLD38_013474 [Melastoma candidum]
MASLIAAVIFICAASLMRRWRNPKCDGELPPGSMGIPFIGETIQIFLPSYSLDIHPFITKRVQRYGTIFKTSLAGQPIVMSADREFNEWVIKQEGRSVEIGYMSAFLKLFTTEEGTRIYQVGEVHKCIRGSLHNHFGHQNMMKQLPLIQKVMLKSMEKWSNQPSVDIRKATSAMLLDFSAIHLFDGYHFEAPPEIMCKRLGKILKGLLAFPLNIPGFAFHECVKEHKYFTNMIRGILKERLSSMDSASCGHPLDDIIHRMKDNELMTEDFAAQVMFVGLFTSMESLSTTITLLLTLISDNDRVLRDLIAENESIVGNDEKESNCISWEQLKSLDFTNQVVKEVLRLANLAPGIFRRVVQDVHVKGMTIPAGWTIILVNSVVHMNPDLYVHPLEFNPWRWKVQKQSVGIFD